jgi:hypothetical protein
MRALLFFGCALTACVGDDPVVAPVSTSDAGADAALVAAPEKLVFVTSTKQQGFFGGQVKADDICRQKSQRPSAVWRAWISDDTNAIDRVGNGPWYRSDHQLVFAGKAALASSPKVPINLDELGNTVSADQVVWTGTNASGQAATRCGLTWGTSIGNATVGQIGAGDKTWTEYKDQGCDQYGRFYCFEL